MDLATTKTGKQSAVLTDKITSLLFVINASESISQIGPTDENGLRLDEPFFGSRQPTSADFRENSLPLETS